MQKIGCWDMRGVPLYVRALAVVILLSAPGLTMACCGVPPSLEADAEAFQAQIEKADPERVRRLQFVEGLCGDDAFACGKLTNAQASKLVNHHFAQQKALAEAEAEAEQQSMRWMLDIALAVVAGLGLLLGVVNAWRARGA